MLMDTELSDQALEYAHLSLMVSALQGYSTPLRVLTRGIEGQGQGYACLNTGIPLYTLIYPYNNSPIKWW